MTKTIYTLADADISSRPTATRRALLRTLGLGAGVAAVSALGGASARSEPPKRRDPCRDQDHGPSDQDGCGRPTS
jgi:hypothetical protein